MAEQPDLVRITATCNSCRQLAPAASLARRHGVELCLIHGNAEQVTEPRPEPSPEVRFFVTADRAARWPSEPIWRLRKGRLNDFG